MKSALSQVNKSSEVKFNVYFQCTFADVIWDWGGRRSWLVSNLEK